MTNIQTLSPKINNLDELYHILCENKIFEGTKFAVSSYGVVKLVTTTVGFFTSLKGAALYTYTLALLGGFFGMLGGVIVLAGMSYFAYKGLNALLKKIFKK